MATIKDTLHELAMNEGVEIEWDMIPAGWMAQQNEEDKDTEDRKRRLDAAWARRNDKNARKAIQLMHKRS